MPCACWQPRRPPWPWTGSRDPDAHVIVYRSAWNARILLSPTPFTAAQIATARKWCDDRSFDVSYYQGIDVAAARDNLYNDLPAVSFDQRHGHRLRRG